MESEIDVFEVRDTIYLKLFNTLSAALGMHHLLTQGVTCIRAHRTQRVNGKLSRRWWGYGQGLRPVYTFTCIHITLILTTFFFKLHPHPPRFQLH